MKLIRAVVLLAVTLYTFSCVRCELVRIFDTISEHERKVAQGARGKAGANAPEGLSAAVPTDALESMNKQNDLLLTWSLAIVAGLTALLTTTKVHQVPLVEWVFILLARAAVFVGGSLVAGLRFQQKMAYLRLNGALTSDLLEGPIRYLAAQNDFLLQAVMWLGLFGGYFLVMIVWGTTRPVDHQ